MPSPTLPTGTVSGGSNGTRTFPIRDAPRLERVRNASSPTDAPRDPDPQSVHEELAHLRQENRELHRALRETRKQRQDVIDRYERLLDAAEPDGGTETPPAAETFEADPSVPTRGSAATPVAMRLAEALEARVESLRRRYRTWIREANL